ncbi:MAG: hypothetical protein AAFX99_35000, partial [Myxococcota bacterium]
MLSRFVLPRSAPAALCVCCVWLVACTDSGSGSTRADALEDAESNALDTDEPDPDGSTEEDTPIGTDAGGDTAELDTADTAVGADTGGDDVEEPLAFCDPPTPLESAFLRVGDNDGTLVIVGGRPVTPAGRQVHLG